MKPYALESAIGGPRPHKRAESSAPAEARAKPVARPSAPTTLPERICGDCGAFNPQAGHSCATDIACACGAIKMQRDEGKVFGADGPRYSSVRCKRCESRAA